MREHSSQVEDVLQRLQELRHWSEELDPRQETLLAEAVEHLSSVLQDLLQSHSKLRQSASSSALGPIQVSLPGTVKPWSEQAEQRLQDSEDLFRPLADNINLVFWIRAPESNEMLYVSPAYEKIWGRTRESLYRASRSFVEAVYPDDRERVIEGMAAHQRGGFDEEYRIVTPDGSVRWITARTFPIEGRNGEITRIAGFAQDITEQKKAEEALRTTLARMRERYVISRRIGAAHMADDVVNALRSLTTIADASRTVILVFSEPWGDVPPSRFDILVDQRDDASLPSLPGEDHVLERYPLAKLFSRDGVALVNDVQADTRLTENDRDWLAAIKTRSVLLFPLITSDQWYGMFNVHYRFPTQMQLEDINYFEKVVNQAAAAIYNFYLLEAETKARKEAEEANELKLKFLAMISHELRTPLTSIKGFATTLLADDVTWDPNSQRDFIETISQEADKLTDLIEQLLDLSRLESGTLRIVPEEQPLNVIVNRARAQLQVLTAEHHLVTLIPEDLPPVRADPQRIAQVMTNLVNNATKYSPSGAQIAISATRKGRHVQVNVTDEGPGIPPTERVRVFEAFHQVPAGEDSAERTKGVGLGLAICKGLVEAQHGRIWVQDRPGPGTTISFTLPIVDPSSPNAE